MSEADQKGHEGLGTYAFAPNASMPKPMCSPTCRPSVAGLGSSGGEDPKIHAGWPVPNAAPWPTRQPKVLMRILDSGLYGNTYDLAEYMDDLTEAIFKADLRSSVNTYRQGLQLMYVEALIDALGEKSRLTGVAQSVVLAQLRRIDRQQRDASSPNGLTRAHRAHVRHLIDVALDR